MVEKLKFSQQQAKEEYYEDIRDDVISLIKNKGYSYEEIHRRFGPTPATIKKWEMKEVKKPNFGKIQSTLHALGDYDLGIIRGRRNKK